MNKDLKPAVVEWIDAHSGPSDWTHIDDLDKKAIGLKMTSVGHLIANNKKGVILCINLDYKGMTSERMYIPRAYIKKIKILKGK